jgi:hypothetical protein
LGGRGAVDSGALESGPVLGSARTIAGSN